MITSASRRTDLPAFYSLWLMNRFKAGYCTVPNPMNSKQVSWISLHPKEVDAIVFWTRDPRPLLPRLDELEDLGHHRYYFLFTITLYGQDIDQHGPKLANQLKGFQALADRIGPDRVVWRYDPIHFANTYTPDWHIKSFTSLARQLNGLTRCCKISMVQDYRKIRSRFQSPALPDSQALQLLGSLNQIAQHYGMTMESCATELNAASVGVEAGSCIDRRILSSMGVDIPAVKDSGQRKLCRCLPSRDIGMYDSCRHGCTYCYATSDFTKAAENYRQHDCNSPSLLGHYGDRHICGARPAQQRLPGF